MHYTLNAGEPNINSVNKLSVLLKFRKVAISMARKHSKNYNYTTQEQIIIKKNADARLPKRLGSDEKIQAASEGSKIE
jgi:hypothetical protein